MISSQPLTVLVVDDEPDFAELVAMFLEREDDRFEVLPVTNATDALDQFADHDIDCIVSDYEMPEMTGLDFLAEVRRIDDHIPFILFTGKGSEAVASDAISAGVTEYLQKHTWDRQCTFLANKIRASVGKYRAEHERQLTIDQTTDAIIEVDDDWVLTTIDSCAEAIYGRDADGLLGRNLWDVFPEAVDTPFFDAYHDVMETREPVTLEEYYEDFAMWFEVHVYPAPSGGLSIYFRDITGRKERDEKAA